MSRRISVQQNQFPYHITGRCINRDWFAGSLQETWQIFCEELWMASVLHDLKIHSFVLMQNHFHLIAETPFSNISQIMKRLMEVTSKRITRDARRINQTYGGRHFKTILQTQSYYLNCYKYVYLNPVNSGICERVEQYPFSTLRDRLGLANSGIILAEDIQLSPDDAEDTVDWLNCLPTYEQIESVKKALKRSWFKHAKCRTGRRYLMNEFEVM